MKQKFIAYLTSGLGNRLRPLASAIAYSKLTGRELVIYWDTITPNGCLATFEELFENPIKNISLSEIKSISQRQIKLFTEKGPGHGALREATRFGRTELLEISSIQGAEGSQELSIHESSEAVLVYDNDFLHSIPLIHSINALRSLVPQSRILNRIKKIMDEIGLKHVTASVHARGTDFGIDKPIDYYSAEILKNLNPDEKFFLSTDDELIEKGLIERFGKRVISRPERKHLALNQNKNNWLDPDSFSITKMLAEEAVVDMYLLSFTNLKVFHPNSTFAQVARLLQGTIVPANRS